MQWNFLTEKLKTELIENKIIHQIFKSNIRKLDSCHLIRHSSNEVITMIIIIIVVFLVLQSDLENQI